jgi:predicted DNA-binding transcriptional regulator YafY
MADRFRRIWTIVEEIAAAPGKSRLQLAQMFHLSERQVQADLNIIRIDMALPLVKRQGYRFAEEGGQSSSLKLVDAQLLILALRTAQRDPSIPRDRLAALVDKLPELAPSHIRPLVRQTIQAVRSPRSNNEGQVFYALADALLRGSWVQLHYPRQAPAGWTSDGPEPIVKPELLLPYRERWYLVAEVRRDSKAVRNRMFELTALTAVTPAADPRQAPGCG